MENELMNTEMEVVEEVNDDYEVEGDKHNLADFVAGSVLTAGALGVMALVRKKFKGKKAKLGQTKKWIRVQVDEDGNYILPGKIDNSKESDEE